MLGNLVVMGMTAALASPTGEVGWEVASSGPVRARLSDAPADLALLVVGEHEGEIGNCGCASRPLGGLDRAIGYRDRVARTGVTTLLVHAGHFADESIGTNGEPRPDATEINLLAVEGLASFDVVNVGFRDARFVDDHPFPQAISASFQHPALPTHRVFDVDGTSVAVVGVTERGLSFLLPEQGVLVDPVEALRGLALTADVMVVLAVGMSRRIEELAGVEGVDLVIDADGHRERWRPEPLEDTLWVRSIDAGQVVTEVRLDLADGDIASATVRSVDLDDAMPSAREVRSVVRAANRLRSVP